MRIALLLGALLGGCLEYEIFVQTKVDADGVHREVIIKEPGEKKPWARFRRPEAPYAITGSDETGYRCAAKFESGTHRSGLRRTMTDEKAGKPKPAVAEGSFTVAVDDLHLGTLYHYDEVVANGTDPARFRKELPQWLDRFLRVTIAALRLKLPEVDFAPAEKNAREKILPRVERAAISIHLHAAALLRDDRVHHYGAGLKVWLDNPNAKAVVAELAALGIQRRGPLPKDADKYLDDKEWDLGSALIDELLAPVKLSKEQRTKLRDDMMQGKMEDLFEQAGKKLYPEGTFEDEFFAFLRAAMGFYMEIFDTCDLKLAVLLPGQILQTNGRIVGSTVAWEFSDDQLALTPPRLVAYSFAPAEGVEGQKWDLAKLLELRGMLAELSEKERATVKELVGRANNAGWGKSLLAAAQAAGDGVAAAINELNALRKASK